MEIKLYLQMLRKGWWLIVLSTLTAVNLALTIDYFATPMFRSTARFIVSPNRESNVGADQLNSLEALEQRSIITTYAEILNSDFIMREVSQATDMTLEYLEENKYEKSSIVLPDANIVELVIEGPDPNITALWANTIGYHSINYVNSTTNVYELDFLDQAIAPEEPFSPQPVRDAALAGALGILVGAALAVVRDQLNTSLEKLAQRRSLDPISHTYNPQFFEQILEDEFVRARDENGIFSLGLVQLTGLEVYIEDLPEPVLHNIIKEVADTMDLNLKGSDSVCRWNETTFAILLPSTPFQATNMILNKIRWALSYPIEYAEDGETLNLEPFVGAARSQDGENMMGLISRAQETLNEARLENDPILVPSTPQKPKAHHEPQNRPLS
jgi:diguanylate cyclase (GGDEF)-like protein